MDSDKALKLYKRVRQAVDGEVVHLIAVIDDDERMEYLVVWRRVVSWPRSGPEYATHRAYWRDGYDSWDLVSGHYMIEDEISALADALHRAGLDEVLKEVMAA